MSRPGDDLDPDAALMAAAGTADLDAMRAALARGASVNHVDEHYETPLVRVIASHDGCRRREAVELLLALGADAGFRGEENCGVVWEAVLVKDAEMMERILAAGANPNLWMEGGSLYDEAGFDYRYDLWDLRLPLEPTDQNQASEEAWLDFLDRCAEVSGRPRPDHLRVLRRHGTLSSRELREAERLGRLDPDDSRQLRPEELGRLRRP